MAAIFAELGREVRISTIGLLEVQSAFAMKVRTAAIDRQLAGQQRAALMLDIASGAVEVYSLTDVHLKDAERLIGKYGFAHRLRTLDALQLAVALDLAGQTCSTTLLLRIERSRRLHRRKVCLWSIDNVKGLVGPFHSAR